MPIKPVNINLNWIIRFLLSVTFMLSALGKLIDREVATLSTSVLFRFPYDIAEIIIIMWSIFELGLMVLVWRRRVSRIIFVVPLTFLVLMLFIYGLGINCGCFGSLPFLSQLSFGAHLLLLVGMFLGLLYLTIGSEHENDFKSEKQTERQQFYQTFKPLTLTGYAALAMMLLAFLTLPFSDQNNNVINSPNDYNFVDRIFVEKAIDNENVIIIDARPEFQYSMGHIPKSLNIPYNTTNLDS